MDVKEIIRRVIVGYVLQYKPSIPLAKKWKKKSVENWIKKALKEYGADVMIHELQAESGAKMRHIHLEADVELAHESLEKVLGKIGL